MASLVDTKSKLSFGNRIELLGPPAPMQVTLPGERGTVIFANDEYARVQWDRGCITSLYFTQDRWQKIA